MILELKYQGRTNYIVASKIVAFGPTVGNDKEKSWIQIAGSEVDFFTDEPIETLRPRIEYLLERIGASRG